MNLYPFGKRRPPHASVLDRIYHELNRPKRLLFMDDNEILTKFFQNVAVRRFAIEVSVADSVADARAQLEMAHFDAALLDIIVSNGTGIALYREMVERWPHIEVCFLTGNDSDEYRRQIEAIGCARVFSKDRVTDMGFVAQLFARWHICDRQVAPA